MRVCRKEIPCIYCKDFFDGSGIYGEHSKCELGFPPHEHNAWFFNSEHSHWMVWVEWDRIVIERKISLEQVDLVISQLVLRKKELEEIEKERKMKQLRDEYTVFDTGGAEIN